jgi:membrane protein DedA with SNARE-associated domain
VTAARHRWSRRRVVGVAIAAAVLLLAVVVVLNRVGASDGFGTVTGESGAWAYVAIAGLVFADAICALFPGETTVNAGATLAATGQLELGLVILASTVGAVVGDWTLYFLARGAGRKFQPRVDATMRNDKVALAMSYLGSSAPALLVVGRYVPGMRFVVNASLGVTRYPWRRFMLWSAIGGTLWAVYTATLAYVVASALADFPLASIVISSAITTAALVVVFFRLRKARREGAPAAAAEPVPSAAAVPPDPATRTEGASA